MALVLTITPVRLKLTTQSGRYFYGFDLRFTIPEYASNSAYVPGLPPTWSFSRTGAGTALQD